MNTLIDNKITQVLLVEDNYAHAELVIRSLEDLTIKKNIHHVLDGEKALEYLFSSDKESGGEHKLRPDLILLDLRLPRIHGLEVLKKVKENKELRSIPVVVFTTSKAEKDIQQAYQFHANSYLVKPISYKDFSKLIADVANYWLNHNQSTV